MTNLSPFAKGYRDARMLGFHDPFPMETEYELDQYEMGYQYGIQMKKKKEEQKDDIYF